MQSVTPTRLTSEAFLFRIGEHLFGIDTSRVESISRLGELTKLPTSPEFIVGVVYQRGEVVPVLDIAMLVATLEPPTRPLTSGHARPMTIALTSPLAAPGLTPFTRPGSLDSEIKAVPPSPAGSGSLTGGEAVLDRSARETMDERAPHRRLMSDPGDAARAESPVKRGRWVVTVLWNLSRVGLVATAVHEVRPYPAARLRTPSPAAAAWAAGSFMADGNEVLVLDLDRLLPRLSAALSAGHRADEIAARPTASTLPAGPTLAEPERLH
jgi:chemotaxis signal transduction protein